VGEVPREAQAHRADRLQRRCAARPAVPVLIASFTRPFWSADPAAVSAGATGEFVATHRVHGTRPVTRQRSKQAPTPGPSWPLFWLETSLEVLQVKPATLGPAADQPVLAWQAALNGERSEDFRRATVDTARTPTGPPEDQHVNRR
jgi:hypothetical protein